MVTVKQVKDAIEVLLAAADSAPPPLVLSEIDLIQQVLDFANDGRPRGAVLAALHLDPVAQDLIRKGFQFAVTDTSDGGAERLVLQSDLTKIATTNVLSKGDFRRLADAARRMAPMQRYSSEKGYLDTKCVFLPKDLSAVLSYATLLLRDKNRPFRLDFARCELASCNMFFLRSSRAEKTGRRGRAYCSPEHMLKRHRQTGADRVKRHRLKVAAKAAIRK